MPRKTIDHQSTEKIPLTVDPSQSIDLTRTGQVLPTKLDRLAYPNSKPLRIDPLVLRPNIHPDPNPTLRMVQTTPNPPAIGTQYIDLLAEPRRTDRLDQRCLQDPRMTA
jgi:hypothetical protein